MVDERLELLSAAIDSDGIVILEMNPADFESREIVYVNRGLTQNTGFTADHFYEAKTTYFFTVPRRIAKPLLSADLIRSLEEALRAGSA